LSEAQGVGGPTLMTDQVRGGGGRAGERGAEGRWCHIWLRGMHACNFGKHRQYARLSIHFLFCVFSPHIPSSLSFPSPSLDADGRAAGDARLAVSREGQSCLSF
jgi:hypothetical protein